MGGLRVLLLTLLVLAAGTAGARAQAERNPDDAPPPKPGSKIFDVEEDLKRIDPAEKGKDDQPQRVDEAPGDRRVVDLLALIDPATAPGLGTWKKNDVGELVSSNEPKAWIEAPFKVGGEYDFVIEFTRLEGNNDTAQIISFGGRKFAWVLGAKDGTRSVFSTIRGRSWGNNTDISTEGLIEPGKRHRCVVSCREGVIFVTLDGRELGRWQTTFKNFGGSPSFPGKTRKHLGVGCKSTVTVFHRIELIEVSGKGEVTGPAAAAEGEKAAPAAERSGKSARKR